MASRLDEPVGRWAWALWTELGVHGPERLHPEAWIDVERLAYVTFRHLRGDSRLAGEAAGWLQANSRFVSQARSRRIGITVPSQGRARPAMTDLDRSGRQQLRLRATFGVTTRAEILGLLEFRARSRQGATTAEIATEAAAGKRSVEVELEGLRLAGLVTTDLRSRPAVHSLTLQGCEVVAALPGQPAKTRAEWASLVAVIDGLYAAQGRFKAGAAALNPIVVQETLDLLAPHGPRVGLNFSVRFEPNSAIRQAFTIWSTDQLRAMLLGRFGASGH